MNQSIDEIFETVKQDVTDGITGYIQLFLDICQEMKNNVAEGPNLTPDDGQGTPYWKYIRRTEEVLAQLRSAIGQLGALSPIAQYTGQNAQESDKMSSATAQVELDEAKSRFLYNQLKASHYSNWLEVATSEFATRGHLEQAARLCAEITNNETYRDNIAKAIASHPAADDEALLPLCDTNYYSVWLTAARSVHAGRKTLTRLAQECAGIGNNEHFRDEIAKALSDHAAADDNTLLPLCEANYYSVWLVAARSSHAGRQTLLKLACQCAEISNNDYFAEEIARALATNLNSTDETLLPLCNSRYYLVWEITAKSQYAGTNTLSKLATECANTSSGSTYINRVAEAIAHHPNCTVDILALMAGARLENVSHIAHERMRDMT